MLFLNKFLNIFILNLSILFIAFGVIVVASGMPKAIKEKSKFNVTFIEKPFTLRISSARYTFHLTTADVNRTIKHVLTTGESIHKIFISIGNKIYDIINLIKIRVVGYFFGGSTQYGKYS